MALLTPVVAQAENTRGRSLDQTMNEIRAWLDGEGIEPAQFRTVVSRRGLGFEISFHCEHEAERFQKRFASLLADAGARRQRVGV
jgi:DNA-binding winged helix-turn-helix (wHTH) protein